MFWTKEKHVSVGKITKMKNTCPLTWHNILGLGLLSTTSPVASVLLIVFILVINILSRFML